MDGKNRKDIRSGVEVDILLKKDQRTERLTRGVVKDILTKSARHPHGIKVRLTDGQVGRVKKYLHKGKRIGNLGETQITFRKSALLFFAVLPVCRYFWRINGKE